MSNQPLQLTPMAKLGELTLRTDGYWYCQWYDDSGSRRTKTFGHKEVVSEKRARGEWQRFRMKWERSSLVRNPKRMKTYGISPIIDEYNEHARDYYKRLDGVETGEADQMKYALEILDELYGESDPQEFRPADLQACQTAMVDRGILSRTTINGRVNRIRRFFRWCTVKDYVKGIIEDLECVPSLAPGRSKAKEPKPVVPVHRNEINAVFAKLPQTLRDMIDVQWYTGMRSGELVIMRSCDIDTTGETWIYKPTHHKTSHRSKARWVYIGPQAQERLRKYLNPGSSAFIFSPHQAMAERLTIEGKEPAVYVLPFANRYSSHSYRRAVHYACDAVSKAAGVSPKEWKQYRWTPH